MGGGDTAPPRHFQGTPSRPAPPSPRGSLWPCASPIAPPTTPPRRNPWRPTAGPPPGRFKAPHLHFFTFSLSGVLHKNTPKIFHGSHFVFHSDSFYAPIPSELTHGLAKGCLCKGRGRVFTPPLPLIPQNMGRTKVVKSNIPLPHLQKSRNPAILYLCLYPSPTLRNSTLFYHSIQSRIFKTKNSTSLLMELYSPHQSHRSLEFWYFWFATIMYSQNFWHPRIFVPIVKA